MIKVVVKDRYLNVRVGKPRLNAPCFQYIAPGSEIEVDGNLYPGDPFEKNSFWLKDGADNYYWSGGVSGLPVEEDKFSSPATYAWFKSMQIDQIWQEYGTKGRNVTVAVIDSGYSVSNPFLKGRVQDGDTYSSLAKNPKSPTAEEIDDNDVDAHGNRCASLVGALSTPNSTLGIAPECRLLIAKIYENQVINNNQFLEDAIKWAIDKGADIISCSLKLSITQAEANALDQRIKAIVANKPVLLLAAAGNTIKNLAKFDFYPACMSTFESIGGATLDGHINSSTAINSKTFIYAPGKDVESYGPGNLPTPDTGTSFSTPIVAGIAALAMSYLKSHNIPIIKDDLLTMLRENGPLQNDIPAPPERRFINPSQLFQKLKSLI